MSVARVEIVGLSGRVVPRFVAAWRRRRRDRPALAQWALDLDPTEPPVHARAAVYEHWYGGRFFKEALNAALPVGGRLAPINVARDVAVVLPEHRRAWAEALADHGPHPYRVAAEAVESAMDEEATGWLGPRCCIVVCASVTISPLDDEYHACDPPLPPPTAGPADLGTGRRDHRLAQSTPDVSGGGDGGRSPSSP